MKNTVSILIILLFSTLCLQGQRGNGNGRNSGGGGGMGMRRTAMVDIDDTALQPPAPIAADSLTPLKQFVSLSDKQLIAIRDVIDQILAMSPEEREKLRQKIAEYEQLDPEKQEFIRQGWGRVSGAARDEWHKMMQSLDNKEKNRIRDKMRTLSVNEKTEYRLQLIEDWKKRRSKSTREE